MRNAFAWNFRDRAGVTERQSQSVEQIFVDNYRSTPRTLDRVKKGKAVPLQAWTGPEWNNKFIIYIPDIIAAVRRLMVKLGLCHIGCVCVADCWGKC